MAKVAVFEVSPSGSVWTVKRRGGGYESVHPTRQEAIERGREKRRELGQTTRLLIKKVHGENPE
jgi:hypothetical protein